MSPALGRREPPDFNHVEKYPLRALIEDDSYKLSIPPTGVERSLGLPWWWKHHDQDPRNACVGFGLSAERSITNHLQRKKETGSDVTYRYDADWLYDEALKIDEWPGEDDEGTSLRAGYNVLLRGHRRIQRGVSGPVVLAHGVSTYRWARSIDEIRAAIYSGLAVAVGTNWYYSMMAPFSQNGEYWIDIRSPGDRNAGGHCYCLFRMSDRRQAFCIMNSWGSSWPPSWISYSTLNRLLNEHGEAAVVTDR